MKLIPDSLEDFSAAKEGACCSLEPLASGVPDDLSIRRLLGLLSASIPQSAPWLGWDFSQQHA